MSIFVTREKYSRRNAFLFEKGDSCREHGDEESAVNFYNQSLNLVKCENDSWLEATLYSRLGTIYMYRDIYSAALEMFKLGASIYATIPPCVERTITLRNIGRVNLLQHQSDSIFCYYDQALEVAMQLSDEEFLFSLSLLAGCSRQSVTVNPYSSLPVLDITADYPEREIRLGRRG